MRFFADNSDYRMVKMSYDEIQKIFNEAICQQYRLRKIVNG